VLGMATATAAAPVGRAADPRAPDQAESPADVILP